MSMLSRVAEHIYWMARYIERAEDTARLINVNSILLLDLPKRVRLGWAPIIEILGGESFYQALYDGDPDERQALKYLISDTRNPGAILSALSQARENARTIRDIIPREAWEQVNDLYLMAKSHAQSGLYPRKRYDYLREIILGAQTITGLLAGTMTHDEGYDFLRMGRNLERADMTTRTIDVRSANLLPEMSEELTPFENIQWVSVLKSITAYQMYRRAVQVRVRRPDVLRFLFKEKLFPRAFMHTLDEVESCLKSLKRNRVPLAQVRLLQETIQLSEPGELSQQELHAFIDSLQLGLAELHDKISQTYFR